MAGSKAGSTSGAGQRKRAPSGARPASGKQKRSRVSVPSASGPPRASVFLPEPGFAQVPAPAISPAPAAASSAAAEPAPPSVPELGVSLADRAPPRLPDKAKTERERIRSADPLPLPAAELKATDDVLDESVEEQAAVKDVDLAKLRLMTLQQLEALATSTELWLKNNDPEQDELDVDATMQVLGICEESYRAPEHCVPICADVTSFDWQKLAAHTTFDVITMDPPWQLAGALPTRGVALSYSQLGNDAISRIPVPLLQPENGLLFVWVINSRYDFTLNMMHRWGYKVVDSVDWVKCTVNRRLAKGHGFYLQHAKETCLVGMKGSGPPGMRRGVASDVIFSERRGQSQKPEELYEYIEALVPRGRYLEIFARKNNLRDYWVSIGNEL